MTAATYSTATSTAYSTAYSPWSQFFINSFADLAYTSLLRIQQRIPDQKLREAIGFTWLALLLKPIHQILFVRRQFNQLNNYDYASLLVSEVAYCVAPLLSQHVNRVQLLLLCSAALSVYLSYQGYRQHMRNHDDI